MSISIFYTLQALSHTEGLFCSLMVIPIVFWFLFNFGQFYWAGLITKLNVSLLFGTFVILRSFIVMPCFFNWEWGLVKNQITDDLKLPTVTCLVVVSIFKPLVRETPLRVWNEIEPFHETKMSKLLMVLVLFEASWCCQPLLYSTLTFIMLWALALHIHKQRSQ